MNNALIYARVSTEEQARDEKHSLKTQSNTCKKAIESSEEYKLAEDGLYEDPGRSATNMNRPGLQDLLIRVEEDKSIKAVFVQETDRLARNTHDHLTIKAILKKHGVILISTSQPGLGDSPEGNFMDIIMAGANELQSQVTARKTMGNLKTKFKGGWWPSLAPIGYLNAGEKGNNKKRIIVVDEERAPLIKTAFKLYAGGDYSIVEVRDIIYKRGLMTDAGKMMSISRMARVFNNHFYYGEMHWKGLVGRGKHKPLITKELFDKCQLVSKEHCHNACRRRKYNFILRGFVFCNICGQRYTAEHHFKKNKSYYHCNRSGDKKIKCSDKYVEVKDLEQQVQEQFNSIQFSKVFTEKVEKRIRAIYEEKKSDVGNRKKSLLATKINFEKKLETAEEKLINGVLSDEGFTRAKNRHREQINNIQDEIYKLERVKNIKMDVIQDILSLSRNIGRSYKKASPELKRLYLGLFWDSFKAQNKELVEANKAPIVLVLEQAGLIKSKTKQKPVPSKRVSANIVYPLGKVILNSNVGA